MARRLNSSQRIPPRENEQARGDRCSDFSVSGDFTSQSNDSQKMLPLSLCKTQFHKENGENSVHTQGQTHANRKCI